MHPQDDILIERTHAELERCLALAEKHFNREFLPDLVSFDLRGRAAGQFRVKPLKTRAHVARSTALAQKFIPKRYQNQLRFNLELLRRYQDDFIHETVGHEVAHFIAYSLYGTKIKPHGLQWQSIMRDVLNRDPDTTHNYETTPARRQEKYSYVCDCVGLVHELGPVRHKRASSGKAQYSCRKCKAPLRPLSEKEHIEREQLESEGA